MAVFAGPEIVNNGIVFHMDSSNLSKSWRGKPTTNFITNGHFSNGADVVQQSGAHNPTNTIILMPSNPGNSDYVLEQSMGSAFTEYEIQLTTQLLPSTTYVMSGWYGESPDYSCLDGSRMFHSRAFSASGAHISLGVGIGTVLETRNINGIIWKYCYATITTPSDYNNFFNWYVGYGSNSYTGKRYYTNLQMELGAFPSRFVDGTRSNIQAILDLTKKNTINAISLTYNTDDSFSFNGVSDYLDCGNSIDLQQSTAITMAAWVNPVSASSLGNIMSKNYNSGYRFRIENTANALWWYVSGNSVQGGQCPNNTWSYCVVTGDASGLKAYVNGLLVASNSIAFTPANASVGNLTIGALVGAEYFNGNISTASMYNRSLSANEIKQNFEATRGRYNV